MIRTHRRFQASLESLEGKTLLSAVPFLSQATFDRVLTQIGQAAGTYAKTHNPNTFNAALSRISYEIPYGHSQLYPTWQADESIYDSTVPGSGVQMVQQIKADLKGYAQSAVADGSIFVRGNWLGDPPGSSFGTTVLPVLSQKTFNQVVSQINKAAGTFAKTHNENVFIASLSQISSKIPYGHSQLFPTWQADTGLYSPSVPGSGVAMVQQLKSDLLSYVQTSVADGSFRYA